MGAGPPMGRPFSEVAARVATFDYANITSNTNNVANTIHALATMWWPRACSLSTSR